MMLLAFLKSYLFSLTHAKACHYIKLQRTDTFLAAHPQLGQWKGCFSGISILWVWMEAASHAPCLCVSPETDVCCIVPVLVTTSTVNFRFAAFDIRFTSPAVWSFIVSYRFFSIKK